MAKSSKVEDFWRQNDLENLFKELTRVLLQRMPPDPIVAIDEFLRKKFPQSFVGSTDNNNIGIASKTMASSLQLQTSTSAGSAVNSDSSNAIEMGRRLSNQSQVSDIVTIPTTGSAFTHLLRQDMNDTRQEPEFDIKKFVILNRLNQGVKLRKDIRSMNDILDEEVIKPIKPNEKISSTTDVPFDSTPGDLQQAETHEEPSVKQLIKYKQQIQLEKDRRLHREKLAELAKQVRDKEQFLQSALGTKSSEVQQQQQEKLDDDHTLSHAVAATSSTKSIHKPIVKSKEEQEILNDEILFQPKKQRHRERFKNHLSTSRSNTPHIVRQDIRDISSSMPIMQFGVCKVCGNIMNNAENQSIRHTEQVTSTPTARTFAPQPLAHSVESNAGVVDDWFESASDVSGPRQVSPWKTDDITPPPASKNPFQQSLFQPINDNNIMQRRSPVAPLIITNDGTKTKQSTTPRMSESDVFVRTPEPKSRRSSSSRSIPSPVTKKHQTDTLAVTSHKLSKTMAHLSPSQTVPTIQRRMSGWGVTEYSPDDSDEN